MINLSSRSIISLLENEEQIFDNDLPRIRLKTQHKYIGQHIGEPPVNVHLPTRCRAEA